MRVDRFGRPIVPLGGNRAIRAGGIEAGVGPSPIYPSPVFRNGNSLGPPPSFVHDQRVVSKLVELEKESNKDEEVIVPLNHWSERSTFPPVTGSAVTFTTPIFDFWYDHIIETGFQSGQVVTAPGPSTAAGTNQQQIQGPGSSGRSAEQWQNHRFEFTTTFVIPSDVSYTITTATITMLGGMMMQMTDEPFTISTMTVTNDLQKSDATVFISGRVPMRFLQFQTAINLSGLSVVTSTSFDIVQQMSVRPT